MENINLMSKTNVSVSEFVNIMKDGIETPDKFIITDNLKELTLSVKEKSSGDFYYIRLSQFKGEAINYVTSKLIEEGEIGKPSNGWAMREFLSIEDFSNSLKKHSDLTMEYLDKKYDYLNVRKLFEQKIKKSN